MHMAPLVGEHFSCFPTRMHHINFLQLGRESQVYFAFVLEVYFQGRLRVWEFQASFTHQL